MFAQTTSPLPAAEASDDVDKLLTDAEDALQRGMVSQASELAHAVCCAGNRTVTDKARALNVLVQADFHFHNRLLDLQQLLGDAGLALEQVPVTVMLLWGVVAVELQAADVARTLLKRYLACRSFGEGSGVSREDALALSRLYAVQLLSGLCGDFQAAADWLADGGAGLSEEQQELLLLEVDEAEELAQEEHVAVWTSQDAAQAVHLANQPHSHTTSSSADAAAAAAAHDDVGSNVGSAVGSLASAAGAALQELGPSASGNLSSVSLHPASNASHEHDNTHGSSHGHEHELCPEVSSDVVGQNACGSDVNGSRSGGSAAGSGTGTEKQAPDAAAAVAVLDSTGPESLSEALSSPAAAAVAAVTTPAAMAAVMGDCVPSSPSLAAWRRSPDELAVPDQGQQNDVSDSPYVTVTGAFDTDNGYDPAATAAVAAAGSRLGRGQGGSPAKGTRQNSSGSSTASSGSLSSSLRAAAGKVASAVTDAASAVGEAVCSAAAAVQQKRQAREQERVAAQGADGEQQEEEEQEQAAAEQAQQQQPQEGALAVLGSYAAWASSRAREAWESQAVQDTLKSLNLQDVPPWELAGGAAAAVLLTYSLYRNRRRVKRAAAGLRQTVRMGLGMSVNPMAAVPGTSHMMR